MRAADASLPVTFAGRPRASPVANALSPGVGSTLLAWAADLVLGLPMIDASPVRVEPSASLRRSSAPRRPRPRPPGLVRSNRQPRELRADPSSPVRSSPLPVVALRRLSASTLVGQAACRRSDTSPEVCVPLQHMPAAMRCPGLGPADGISADGISLAGLRTIPLRRFRFLPTRALLRDRSASVRPCGFPLFGGAKRRRSKCRTCRNGSRCRKRAASTRRLTVAEQTNFRRLRSTRAGVLRGNRCARSRAIRTLERYRFNPPPEPGHAPSRSFGAVFRYPRFRAFAAWPDEWSFPQFARRRSWGSCPSQSCPATGGATFLPSRAHVPFAPRARPD